MVGYPSDSLASCMKVRERERDGGAEVTLAGRSFHMGGPVLIAHRRQNVKYTTSFHFVMLTNQNKIHFYSLYIETMQTTVSTPSHYFLRAHLI